MNSTNNFPSLPLISKASFESTVNGVPVSLYTLTNKNHITMQVTNFGCRVVSLYTPDKDGNWDDIVLGRDSLDSYVNCVGERFLGATIGRYGNRIAKGHFTLNGKEYTLAQNNGENALHGGNVGFDMVAWNVESFSNNAIVFSYLSKDKEEGYPGNLKVTMTYTLTDDNEFRIDYEAVTDQDTILNLTHHSFFNLKGAGNGTIHSHIMQINADYFTPVNSNLIPLGKLEKVEGTPLDFRTPEEVGKRIEDSYDQMVICRGYDQCFVINRKTASNVEHFATVYEPSNGRYFEVLSTEPGMQFYSGNFFDGNTPGKYGKKYDFRQGFALETQHFPDSPNQPQFPSTVLKPGEKYTQTTIYKFGVK